MIRIKSDDEIARMKGAGAVVAAVFEAVAPLMKPGISTGEINRTAHRVIVDAGATPSFLGYGPAEAPFPRQPASQLTRKSSTGYERGRIRKTA